MLSASGNMQGLAGLGFLVGVLLIMFQGIMQARPPQFQNLLLAMVIYMGMFGPSVEVSVEDVYSGQVRVVDHVPLGPAVIGSVVSKVGYSLTRVFEQAFSTPSMTEYGFAAPLHLLQDVRRTTLSATALGVANSPTPGADIKRTMVNYLSTCLLYTMNNGTRTTASALREPDWHLALAVDKPWPTTQLWLGGAPVTKSCPDAWTQLSSYLVTNYVPKLKTAVAATAGIRGAADMGTAIQSALDALAGPGVAAQDYMIMATAASMLPYARADQYRALLQTQEAAMVVQATEQRNTQWAAEERLFSRIVRPMMTFFEAFLYAVSPMMVFAIGLGPVGIQMVGKYLLFGLWIQLWQPILAIINLYIIMAAKLKLDAFQDVALGNTPLPAIEAIWHLDFLLSDYLGVGGMLAASTPAISLMLIYGSAITATHLAGRLQGGDHINEKQVTPDVVSTGAAMTIQPQIDRGVLRGTAAPGAEQQVWRFDMGAESQRELRSAQQAMESSSQAFSSALGNAASVTASRSGESFQSHASSWMREAGKSQTDQVLMQEAAGIARKYAESGMSTKDIAAVLAGGLGLKLRGNGIASELKSQYGVKDALAHEMGSDMAQRTTVGSELSTRVAEGQKVDSQTGDRNVFTSGLDSRETSTLSQSADNAVSASRSLARAESTSERYSTGGTYNAVPTGQALTRPEHQAEMAGLEAQIARHGLEGDVQYATQQLLAGGVTADPDQARAIAGMGLLLGHTHGQRAAAMSAEERATAKEAGMEILGRTFNLNTPQGINPGRNAGLEGAAPGFGGVRREVQGAGLRDVRPLTNGLRGEVDRHNAETRAAWNPRDVDAFAAHARGETAAVGRDAMGAMRSAQGERLGALIDQRAETPRTPTELIGGEVGGVAGRAVNFSQDVGRELFSGDEGLAGLNAARMDQIESYGLTQTQSELYREAASSWFSRMAPGEAQQVARQAVIREAGDQRRGEHIADLIERSASTRDDTDLRLIGTYNQAQPLRLGEKKSPKLGSAAAPVPLSAPVAGLDRYPVTSGFSAARPHPVTGEVRPHRGVDFAMPVGTPVYAAADGMARTGFQAKGAGNYVALDHGGDTETKYMHLDRMVVQDGDAVVRGQVIGYSGNTGGSTGPHLHYEVWRDGEAVDPRRDPVAAAGPAGGQTGAVAGGPGPGTRRAASTGSSSPRGAIRAPADLAPVFRSLEQKFGLPSGMLTAIASVESDFNPRAVSRAGAQGMFQLMPATAQDYRVSDPFNPREAARGAAEKLAADYERFGRWDHAVAAYNAGTGRMEKFLAGDGPPLSEETREYVPKVLAAFHKVQSIT